ncbi:MAG TPA: hypothetical protein EYP10_02500, partial [Armatimonadetes bacterium]|nr:hypothetical protein [Armatimonadota bacterium]
RMASAHVDGDLSEWDGKSTAWLDYTYSWARFGRWLEQIYDGGEHLSEFFNTCKYVDVRGAIWCGWNDDGIFVGVRVWDDSLAPMRKDSELCDAIEIHLDGDVTDDDVNAPRTDDVIIRISLREGLVSERLANGAIACAKPLDDGWCAEAFIPHRALRIKPRVYDIIGIDIFLHDADVVGRKRTHAILRWAGGSRSTGHAWLLASD